ncbi:MAG: carboxypeptidase-like regulatory domain-containing protein [Bacteroidota bacterium]|nr:carboxypeptidase-like regulatory domain-containing protein [Bacteroidota bacterium]
MKKIFTELILFLLLFSGCEKSEIKQLDLKGTLKGKIYTLDEFGYQNSDNENIVIKLKGSEPLISIITDTSGIYEIKDIPSGTYNLIISKEGYGEYQRQGIQIVGGNEPLYFNGSIIEKSSTTIENLSLEIVNSTEVYLKGIVNHNYIIDQWSFWTPAIRYFINNSNNPSDNNYLQTSSVSFNGDSGSQMESRIYIDMNLFPSGSKIYVIAYGCYGFEYGYYDILSNQYKYSSLGTRSNIASITIP